MQRTQNHPSTETSDAMQWQVNPLHESAEADAPEWQSNPLYESEADIVVHTRSAKRRLSSSKKGGLFRSNSSKFNAVDKGLDEILKLLSTAFTGDSTQDQKSQHKLQTAYSELIDSCQKYNTSVGFFSGEASRRQAHTENGRNRQTIVDEIETMAQKDLIELMAYFDKMPGLPPEERARSVADALRIARTTTLKLKGSWGAQKHLGGAISDLIAVKSGGFEGTSRSGIFKKAEFYESSDSKSPKQRAMDSLAAVSEKISISKNEYQIIYDHLANQPDNAEYINLNMLKSNELYFRSESFHDFVNVLNASYGGKGTAIDYMETMVQADPSQKKVNYAHNNVAAARLANLLGQGHLVAQSELATLEDENGAKIEGFMMQKAEGVEGREFAENVLAEEIKQKREQNGGKALNRNTLASNLTSLENMVSPEFQKSLADLQVLDNLFGQVDRHCGNYMVQHKGGQLTGLTAIDNDFSFGMDTIGNKDAFREDGTLNHHNNRNQWLWYAADSQNNLTIPHMSEGLANAILQLTQKQITYTLADVLAPAAIKGLWRRISQMQEAIRKEKKQNPQSKRFLKDDEWNSDTLQDFKNHGFNYIGDFLTSRTDAAEGLSKLDMKLSSAEVAWNQAIKEGKMSSAEKSVEFINDLFEKDIGAYLIQSGQVQRWYVPGKGIPFSCVKSYMTSGGFYSATGALRNLYKLYPDIVKIL